MYFKQKYDFIFFAGSFNVDSLRVPAVQIGIVKNQVIFSMIHFQNKIIVFIDFLEARISLSEKELSLSLSEELPCPCRKNFLFLVGRTSFSLSEELPGRRNFPSEELPRWMTPRNTFRRNFFVGLMTLLLPGIQITARDQDVSDLSNSSVTQKTDGFQTNATRLMA